MANVKISDLTAAASALGTQEFEVNESGTSKKVTGAQIASYVRSQVVLGDVGITATASEINTLDGITASTAELNILDGVTASTAELNYTDGVTSNIQTQLDGKASNTTQSQATWEAGTSTTESIVSPAKVKAAVNSQFNVSGSAPKYACRAWVNWDGNTGSGNTIRGSGNVSSVVRTATGEFTVNFSTAMPDANYAIQLSTGTVGGGFGVGAVTGRTTSAMGFVQNRLDVPGRANSNEQYVAIFR